MHLNGQQIEPVSCDTPGAYLVMTQQEFAQASPFYLDLESAAQISGALLIALGTAFVLRVLRKYLEQA